MRELNIWMQKNGVTQNELAAQLGVSQSFLSIMLHGKRKPSVKTAIKIEEVTGIPYERQRPDIFKKGARH